MSRGLGVIQRAILDILADWGFLDTERISAWMPDRVSDWPLPATPSQKEIVRRALRTLESRRLVERSPISLGRQVWGLSTTERERRSPPTSNDRRPRAEQRAKLAKQRAKLEKVLGMVGSAHEGERQAAIEMADRLLREMGLTWGDALKR
jgi:hypothetical protein